MIPAALFSVLPDHWDIPEYEDEEEERHNVPCPCETCIQNHPEWIVLYYPELEDAETALSTHDAP